MKKGHYELVTTSIYLDLIGKIPVRYVPNIDTTKWETYVKQICPEHYISMLQEYTGFNLYRECIIKKALLLYGGNDCGKSTFLSIIRTFLGGNRNVSSIGLTEFSKDYNAYQLYNKLANIEADIVYQKPMKRPDLFKKLVGGGKDSITVRQIYGKPFDMINHAKMWFSANGIPILPKDADPAYFNRWLPIPFPNVFQGERFSPK